MSTRMTESQAESLQRWWKAALFCFALALMLDLVYLGVCRPGGPAKATCWVIAAVVLAACVYAVRQLYRTGYTEPYAPGEPGQRYHPLALRGFELEEEVMSFLGDDD